MLLLKSLKDVNLIHAQYLNFREVWLSFVLLPIYLSDNILDKVLKNGPSKICGRQSLKNLKEYGLLKQSA